MLSYKGEKMNLNILTDSTTKPLKITKNGLYEGGTDEQGRQIAFSPVEVDIPYVELQELKITKNGLYEGGTNERGDKIGYDKVDVNVPLPVKPLTVTKNGTYEGGIEGGKQVGFNPVVVDVPLPVEPLTVTENGVYEAEQGKGFNIVNVEVEFDKSAVVKEIIRLRNGSMYCLFDCYSLGSNLTDEDLQELLKYDTTEDATLMEYTFRRNPLITKMPLMNTKKITSAVSAFNNCPLLEYIPEWDMRSCGDYNLFVNLCIGLKEIWIKNIKANFAVNSSSLLIVESAIHLLYECRDTGSAKTITFSKQLQPVLETVYVKSIAITDAVRERFEIMEGVVIENDDLIDEKMPFVVCEPTDEDATLITEYVLLKNWQVAFA